MNTDEKAMAAGRIVERLVSDLTGRSGLDHAWDGIDEGIRQEILEEWTSIVAEELGD